MEDGSRVLGWRRNGAAVRWRPFCNRTRPWSEGLTRRMVDELSHRVGSCRPEHTLRWRRTTSTTVFLAHNNQSILIFDIYYAVRKKCIVQVILFSCSFGKTHAKRHTIKCSDLWSVMGRSAKCIVLRGGGALEDEDPLYCGGTDTIGQCQERIGVCLSGGGVRRSGRRSMRRHRKGGTLTPKKCGSTRRSTRRRTRRVKS